MKKTNGYEKLYQELKKQQEDLHVRNRRRIRTGIRCIFIVPMIFLLLLFLTDSNRVIFLTLWIASLFALAAYLIYVEYADFQVQKTVAEISRKEMDATETLLDGDLSELRNNTPELLRRLDKKLPEDRKNIRRIILWDFHKLSTNVVAIVVVMGLVILPSLYAWFNILSNWNPYGESATSRLKIAVVSKDQGFSQGHLKLCVGDTIAESLSSNSTMGWTFPKDERSAINGVYDGTYYAALVIPENFTRKLAGVLEGDLEGGLITYYENEKKNAIATKITSKAKTSVQQQVNRSVFASVTNVLLKLGSSLREVQAEGSLEAAATERLKEIDQNITEYLTTLKGLQETGTSAKETLATVHKLSEKLIQDLRSDLSLVPDSSIQFTGLQAACVRLSDYADCLQTASANVKETRKILKDLQKLVRETIKSSDSISDNAQLQSLLSSLSENPDRLSGYLSSLLETETIPVYKTANYGSSMASFYTVLAIWVGALILAAILHVKLHGIPGVTELKTYQEFFGRYTLFFLIGQAQTLLCVLGDLFFIHIQCQHPILFWLAASVSSFVFTLMIYSLIFVFGNVGEALAVVIMVIQVAGTGGTFPREVLPDIYQKVFDFLPFPYCMTALRECVSGMYRADYWIALGKLLIFAAVFLAMALLLKKPFRKVNARIERSKEKSGLMV